MGVEAAAQGAVGAAALVAEQLEQRMLLKLQKHLASPCISEEGAGRRRKAKNKIRRCCSCS